MAPKPIDPVFRLLSRVEINPDTGCWEWPGTRGKAGYGKIKAYGRMVAVHRFAYLSLVGPVPDGLHLDHLCRVRHCCNPDHLEPVTPLENSRRGISGANQSAKTHCPQGHPYSGENLLLTRQGWRCCRTCARSQQRATEIRRQEQRNLAEVLKS